MTFPFPLNEPVVRPDEIELRDWLKKCKDILAGRDATEVCRWAIFAGFDASVVYRVLSDFRHAMEGSSVDNCSALHVWSFEMTVEQVQKMRVALEKVPELDLSEKWRRHVAYSVTGEI